MQRKYDIFEVLRSGNPVWLMSVVGHEEAISQAKEIAARSRNELRVMHLPTNAVVAVVTPRTAPSA